MPRTLLVAIALAAAPGLRAQTPDSAHPAAGAARTIAPGERIEDSLTARDAVLPSDSTYAQVWTITVQAGAVVTVDVASTAFDAFLYVRGPGVNAQDDDSGGRCNARLTVAFPAAGPYAIVVTTSAPRATGPYVLAVRAGAAPPSLAPCRRPR